MENKYTPWNFIVSITKMETLPRICVIGLGNLAWSLIANLQRISKVHQIIGRSNLDLFQKEFQIPFASHSLADLHPDTKLIFLTVGDGAIPKLAQELAVHTPSDCLFVHCSGSTSLDVLATLGDNIGVFYPLQTFSLNRITSFEEIPLFLEGNEQVLSSLQTLARQLSPHVYQLDSEQRQKLHLGGVLVSNFPNLLFRLAETLVAEPNLLDFRIFEPLIREQIDKVFALGPANSQTGPAIRRDQRTIDLHLHLLNNEPEIKTLYEEMTRLIQLS